ncbi:hypothetical protein OHB19_04415 [Streptomyces sp. NBC_00893]|nr:hypothetical protein [Streptomyces sp. NBC_00893]MCX4844589.1 hypothetical protein [Streptomyces sp. NBC_00893]
MESASGGSGDFPVAELLDVEGRDDGAAVVARLGVLAVLVRAKPWASVPLSRRCPVRSVFEGALGPAVVEDVKSVAGLIWVAAFDQGVVLERIFACSGMLQHSVGVVLVDTLGLDAKANPPGPVVADPPFPVGA